MSRAEWLQRIWLNRNTKVSYTSQDQRLKVPAKRDTKSEIQHNHLSPPRILRTVQVLLQPVLSPGGFKPVYSSVEDW